MDITIYEDQQVIDRLSLSKAISLLHPRYRYVLELHYGLTGDAACTVREIAKELGVSPSRVNQMKASALRKLRHPRLAKMIKWYWFEWPTNG